MPDSDRKQNPPAPEEDGRTSANGEDREQESAPDRATAPEAEHELAPLLEMWRHHGHVLTVAVAVAVLATGVFVWLKGQRESAARDAQESLFQSRSSADLQSYLERHARAEPAPAASLLLAHTLYQEGRALEALDQYDRFLAAHAGHELAPVASIGRAFALAASGRADTALLEFERLLTTSATNHFVLPQTVLGRGLCLETLGRIDEARVVYEDFIASHPRSEWLGVMEETLKNVGRPRPAPAETAPELGTGLPAIPLSPALPEVVATGVTDEAVSPLPEPAAPPATGAPLPLLPIPPPDGEPAGTP